MKIYLVSQRVNNGYDTYDSMVVVAENEEKAKRIHPSSVWGGNGYYDEQLKQFWNKDIRGDSYLFENKYGSWTNNLDSIETEYLGEAKEGSKLGIICASFNAG